MYGTVLNHWFQSVLILWLPLINHPGNYSITDLNQNKCEHLNNTYLVAHYLDEIEYLMYKISNILGYISKFIYLLPLI